MDLEGLGKKIDLERLDRELEEFDEFKKDDRQNSSNPPEEDVDLDRMLAETNSEKVDVKREEKEETDLSDMLDEEAEKQTKSRHL